MMRRRWFDAQSYITPFLTKPLPRLLCTAPDLASPASNLVTYEPEDQIIVNRLRWPRYIIKNCFWNRIIIWLHHPRKTMQTANFRRGLRTIRLCCNCHVHFMCQCHYNMQTSVDNRNHLQSSRFKSYLHCFLIKKTHFTTTTTKSPLYHFSVYNLF